MPPFFSAELNGQRVLALRHVFTVSVCFTSERYHRRLQTTRSRCPRIPASPAARQSPVCAVQYYPHNITKPPIPACSAPLGLPRVLYSPLSEAVARGCPPAGQVIHGGSEVDQRAPSSSSARKNAREHAFFAKEDEEISVSLLTDR